jgi:hypothetical protein
MSPPAHVQTQLAIELPGREMLSLWGLDASVVDAFLRGLMQHMAPTPLPITYPLRVV